MTPEKENPDWKAWLKNNHGLRMDANRDGWEPVRRDFHLGRYRFAAPLVAGKDVLDAACGTGYGTAILAQQAATVAGVDISGDAVSYAREHYAASNTRFVQAPVELTAFPDQSFDAVVSFETLEHTLSPQAALREFARVLRPKGELILSAPNDWGYTKDHFFDLDQPMLEKLLGERFERWTLYYNNSGKRRRKEYSGTAGIGPLADLRDGMAECLIAVCSGPKPSPEGDRDTAWMLEVYQNSMWRHRQFQKAWKRFRRWPLSLFAKHWGWERRTPDSRG